MKKLLILLTVVTFFILVSCNKKDFDYGVNKLGELDEKYNSNTFTTPTSFSTITGLAAGLEELKQSNIKNDPFNLLLDYRIHYLKANEFFIEDQNKYGEKGTTKKGFGCKGRPRIINSSFLRNNSALEGFRAVESMVELIETYPEEADESNITLARVSFLNTTYTELFEQANRDRRVIDRLCPQERYEEIMKREELKRKLLE